MFETIDPVQPGVAEGIAVQQALEAGTPLFENPLATIAPTVTGQLDAATAQIATIAASSPPALVAALMVDAQAAVGSAVTAATGLFNHTQTMMFGDANGSIISGGLQSNIVQAQSANALSNSISLNGGTPATCNLFGELFGSIQGVGAVALGAIGAVALTIKTALDAIPQLINGAINVIVNGELFQSLQTAIDSVNQTIGGLLQAANNAISMVTNELNAFKDWGQKQLDFAFGNILSRLKLDPCVSSLIGSVGTPQLSSLI